MRARLLLARRPRATKAAVTSPRFAFLVATIGIGTYSLMDVAMKALALAHGAYPALWWRSVAGVLLVAPLFVARGGRWPARRVLALHLQRGLPATLSGLLFFWGLARVPMAQAVALTFPIPIMALFLARLFLGEPLRARALTGAGIAAGGVIVIAGLEPGARGDPLATLALLGAALCYALSLIALRRQAQAASAVEVTLFTGLVFAVLLSLGAGIDAARGGALGIATLPARGDLPLILGAALLGSGSAMLLAWAYARAGAGLLSLSEYSAFLWAALLGAVLFDERVSLFTIGGAALIIAGCLVALRKEAA
ncbi:MAG: hypothetical protein A4S16_02635 [Proteobacteria bacterium SG_bin6]|nr:MAG: hypothetical protein A4S16_02635 [Proteobacteria bacterium SG_bin6]